MRPAIIALLLGLCLLAAGSARAEGAAAPDFSAQVANFEARPGFLELYIDHGRNRVYAALPPPDADGTSLRFIYSTGLTAGLGSNPIGLDRGNAGSGDIVRFRQIGPRMVAEAENWKYRASSGRPDEEASVRQSFAVSFLWSSEILATDPAGRRLVDLTGFLLRDHGDIASALRHGPGSGEYRLSETLSMPDPEQVLSFPDNAEIDVFLTFETARPNSETQAAAADGRFITLTQHHSFVRLPASGYTTRHFDQRTANIGMGFHDFSAPLGDPLVSRLSRRFRLERTDPEAEYGPVRKPIIFYVDNGAPEEIRDALIEGASWWAEGFEKAGFQDAFRVEILPQDAHPLDVRYNVINWVHRQTRGWSYGGSVSDPRTGEILKANVILGSQRIRQDRMIFEGLAGAGKTGSGGDDDPIRIALQRIRQLAAHEVGHTLGFAHNFAASSNDRASVMDYPAPLIRPAGDGGLDFSEAYSSGLGAWDLFTVRWLYSEFSGDADPRPSLDAMVSEAYGRGLRFVSDDHARSAGTAHPFASVWDNGNDPAGMLDEVMQVRQIALNGFGPDVLAPGRPVSDLNAVIVPIYLYHRYQTVAAAKMIGGLDFRYSVAGQDEASATPVSRSEQERALAALIRTLEPRVLDLPEALLNQLTPGDIGYAGGTTTDELFTNRTGPVFDLLSAADIAADLTLSALLDPVRANRLVSYEQRTLPSLTLEELLDRLDQAVFADPGDPRLRLIAETIRLRFISRLIGLSRSDLASVQVRARADSRLATIGKRLEAKSGRRKAGGQGADRVLSDLIGRHLAGDHLDASMLPEPPVAPAGAPIGAMGQEEDCWHCPAL